MSYQDRKPKVSPVAKIGSGLFGFGKGVLGYHGAKYALPKAEIRAGNKARFFMENPTLKTRSVARRAKWLVKGLKAGKWANLAGAAAGAGVASYGAGQLIAERANQKFWTGK